MRKIKIFSIIITVYHTLAIPQSQTHCHSGLRMYRALSQGNSTGHQQKTSSNANPHYSPGWRLHTVDTYLRISPPTTPDCSYKSTYHPWPRHQLATIGRPVSRRQLLREVRPDIGGSFAQPLKKMEGQRYGRNGLWTFNLQANNSHKDNNAKTTTMQLAGASQTTLNSGNAHSVYECTNKRDLVRFLHAAAFSPVQDTWLKAIRAGHFATWPGLTEDLVRKHLPKEIATVKGHLSQRRKNMRSTTATVAMPAPEAIKLDDITPVETSIKTHQVFSAMVDVGKVYGNLTG
jgi:hypothetical protein